MFAFRLAAHLHMPVKAMLAAVDSAEFTEWLAFERMEPFGALAEEYRIARIPAAIFNSRRREKADHYFLPEEFSAPVKAALERARSPRSKGKAKSKTDNLTPEQHQAWFDASIFGVTKH